MTILNNPQARQEIIQRLACGESQTSVSKRIGVSQQHISRIANRDDIKACVELERLRLAEVAPAPFRILKTL